jgi:hypothetical protein
MGASKHVPLNGSYLIYNTYSPFLRPFGNRKKWAVKTAQPLF